MEMELAEFQTIVTFISLFIAIVSLVVTLVNVWSHPTTVIVQAEPEMKLSVENSAFNKKIDDIHSRLFDR